VQAQVQDRPIQQQNLPPMETNLPAPQVQPQIQTQQPPISNAPLKRANSNTAQQKEFHYNWCLLLGIPKEFSEQDVMNSMRAQGLEPPQSFEWVDEGPIQYLKAYFSPTIHAFNLIISDFKVGYSQNMIYPVMILPWAETMPVSYTLPQHQIKVESSIDVDNTLLYQHYRSYGDIVDILEVNPRTHILIFTKQPKASAVLQMERSMIKNQNGDSIYVNHFRADAQYPVLRKNLRFTLEGLKLNSQTNFGGNNNNIPSPLSVNPVNPVIKTQKPEIRTSQQQQQQQQPSKPQLQIQTQSSQSRQGQERLVIQTQSHLQAQAQLQAQTQVQPQPQPQPQPQTQPQVQDQPPVQIQPQAQNPKVFKTERYESKSIETRQFENPPKPQQSMIEEKPNDNRDRGQYNQQQSNQRDDRYNDNDRNRSRDNYHDQNRSRDNYYNNNRNYNGGNQNRNNNRNHNNNRNYPPQRNPGSKQNY